MKEYRQKNRERLGAYYREWRKKRRVADEIHGFPERACQAGL